MDKKRMLMILGGFVLCIILVGIYFNNNREYRYVCFNQDMIKEQTVREEYLDECISKDRLPKGVITDKSEILTDDEWTSYIIKIDKYIKGEMLYKDDFILHEYPKSEVVDIQLLNELEVVDHGNGFENIETYRLYIEDKKLYANNKDTGENRLIFDKEEVKNIALRSLCCAGDSRLLILTTNGNVYISLKNATYGFNFDSEFLFDKLKVSDVVSFKLVPKDDIDIVKDLYVIDSSGNEIKVDDSKYRFDFSE